MAAVVPRQAVPGALGRVRSLGRPAVQAGRRQRPPGGDDLAKLLAAHVLQLGILGDTGLGKERGDARSYTAQLGQVVRLRAGPPGGSAWLGGRLARGPLLV